MEQSAANRYWATQRATILRLAKTMTHGQIAAWYGVTRVRITQLIGEWTRKDGGK